MSAPVRNPTRVVEALRTAVGAFPELRVGAVLVESLNAQESHPDAPAQALFYIEDDDLAAAIYNFVRWQQTER